MGRASTPSFVFTQSLLYGASERQRLDKIFRCAGYIQNNLIANRKKALEEMEKTKEWRDIQSSLSALFKEIGDNVPTKEQLARKTALYERRNKIMSTYGMNKYYFIRLVQQWRRHYKDLVGTHVAQKIALQVWAKFEDYLFGIGKRITFCAWQNFFSIEGKNNEANIVYEYGVVRIGKMKLQMKPPSNQYEQNALDHRVKYCRITRIPWKENWVYRLQLVMEGEAPIKTNEQTGEVKYPLGIGRAGIDIGTQTLAFVSQNRVSLEELANLANLQQREIRRINRSMDRSHQTMNPGMFNPDGTIIKKPNLPPELLNKKGNRDWKNSKHYEREAQMRRFLYAKQARTRKCQHQTMANQLLQCGDTFYVEKMDFKALAKNAKKQKLKPGEKAKRRKRFGKSIANKAPAMMLDILTKKVITQGGQFIEINTWKAKASQYNHLNYEYRKAKLSQRKKELKPGLWVQRDLYSAFLIMNTNAKLDGFIQELCDSTFEHFLKMHNMELKRLKTIHTPSSTGVRCAV